MGIAEGEVLVIYLDRAEDDAPVTKASLEVTIDGETVKAEPQDESATYEVTTPAIRAARVEQSSRCYALAAERGQLPSNRKFSKQRRRGAAPSAT